MSLGDPTTLSAVARDLRREFGLTVPKADGHTSYPDALEALQRYVQFLVQQLKDRTTECERLADQLGKETTSAPAPSNSLLSSFDKTELEAPSAWDILAVCLELAKFLMSQNKKYGDSALNPRRIVSSAEPDELIKVRIDDKLNRLLQGSKIKEDEDVLKDLVGYWVLLRVLEKRKSAAEPSSEKGLGGRDIEGLR